MSTLTTVSSWENTGIDPAGPSEEKRNSASQQLSGDPCAHSSYLKDFSFFTDLAGRKANPTGST